MAVTKEPDMPNADSRPAVEDPMARFFAGANDGIDVALEDYEPPEEIRSIFDEHGLSKRHYRCILKELPDNVTDYAKAEYIKSWTRSYPPPEWIALNYGPGTYMMVFHWPGKDPETGKMKTFSEQIVQTISEKHRDAYDKHQLAKRIRDTEDSNRLIQSATLRKKLSMSLTGEEQQREDPAEAGKQYVANIVEAANMLGLTKQQVSTFPWREALAGIMPAIPVLFKMWSESAARERERNEKFFLLLMNQSNSSVNQMVELMKSQNGPASGVDYMKNMSDMIFAALDIKNALSGEKEGLSDKIFGMIERTAPAILAMATMSKAQREQAPEFKAAQAYMNASPDFQKLSDDPRLLADVVKKCDAFYGWEQTDGILSVTGYERPAECPRKPEEQYPAQMRADSQPSGNDEAEKTEEVQI